MAIHTGKRLALNRHLITDEEYKDAFDATLGSGHFIFYNHFGSLESEDLIKSIRYMATAEQCDFVILDHITIAISGLDIDNERKATDVLMTRLRSLAEETGVGLLVISHLKRVDGQPAEEGGAISLSHLRGSQALSHLSERSLGVRTQPASRRSKREKPSAPQDTQRPLHRRNRHRRLPRLRQGNRPSYRRRKTNQKGHRPG